MALGKGLKEGPFDAARQLEPAHKLGAPLKHGEELAGNRNESHRAQAQATVHKLEQGVTGKGIGRHGRKGRTR